MNNLRPFSGMCLILDLQFDWLYTPIIFVMPEQDIPQSFYNAVTLVNVSDKVITQITLFFLIVNMIQISWISTFRGYYPHFVDIICICHIMTYLDHNFCRIFHIYSSIVSDRCITYFTIFNSICFMFPLPFALLSL